MIAYSLVILQQLQLDQLKHKVQMRTKSRGEKWIYVCHRHADTSNLILFLDLFLLHLSLPVTNLPLPPLTHPTFISPLLRE